jgi:hypothetical protein
MTKSIGTAVVAYFALAACAGSPGPQGEKGADGAAATNSTLGGVFEAETRISGSADTGENRADPSASNGSARFASASSTPGPLGRLWSIDSVTAEQRLGIGRTRVVARVKVASNAQGVALAELGCFSKRRDATNEVAVAAAVPLFPNLFPGSNGWIEVQLDCDFLPDDQEQRISVDDFIAGVTDLSLDYVRLDTAGSLAPRLPRLYQQGATSLIDFPNTDASCSITANSPWTDIPGMAISVTVPSPTEVELEMVGSLAFDRGLPTAGLHCALRYLVDGAVIDGANPNWGHILVSTSEFSWAQLGTARRTVLLAGTHSITVQGRTGLCAGSPPDSNYCRVEPPTAPGPLLTVLVP